ncbi:MAG: sugar-binding transcriptional regulator [Spirochaetaceae bacterium]
MDNRRLLKKIAHMYYGDELTQRDIAERLNVSMATVSRALSRAKQQGIVEIRIHGDEEGYGGLERAIENAYGLRECLVVPGATQGAVPGTRGGGHVFGEMAKAVSELVPRLLRSGEYLGVSWGETLKAVADKLSDSAESRVDVVPIIGAMGEIETGIYPNAIAGNFARKLGGSSYLVNAPAVLDTPETGRSIRRDGNFVRILRLWKEITTVLVGVSGLGGEDSVSKYGILRPRELKTLREAGAVAAVNFTFIDASGSVLETELDERMIKMDAEGMKAVPNVVGVAAGRRKAAPLRAALSSGLLSVLVTDVDAATELVHSKTDGKAAGSHA